MRRKRTAPDMWWMDENDQKIRRLTWLEWIEVRELALKGAKLGLHKPGLWRQLGLS